MASIRTPALPRFLPRHLIIVPSAPLIFCTVAMQPAVAGGTPGPIGWFDSTDPGSYHVRAARTPHAHPRHPAEPEASTAARDHRPGYCVEAAAGLRVAAPLSFISGKPVVCGAGASGPSPMQLAEDVWRTLRLPTPIVQTAPPRNAMGLVGLPEWIWTSRSQWHSLTRQASAGGVWARVTATPRRLSISPGDGLPTLECAGPGTPYDPRRSALAQTPGCSYTYRSSSATQPGSHYRVRVRVFWAGSWTGSDGTGGPLPQTSRSITFSLRIGEAQGLYG
jgi:hypothetical protein